MNTPCPSPEIAATQAPLSLAPTLIQRVLTVLASAQGLPEVDAGRELIERQLLRRLEKVGPDAFLDRLNQAEQGESAAITWLRNAVTVNYTYFWREPEHFDILLEHLMLKLRRCRTEGVEPTLRLCSAGCASGEEAWSMAIIAAEAQRITGIPARVDLLACDIDTEVLDKARRGVYPAAVLQQAPESCLERYLSRTQGEGEDARVVAEPLRQGVRFTAFDLLAPTWPDTTAPRVGSGFDAIFLRNVLIYLSDFARVHVFEMLAGRLARDGLLFLSRVENGMHSANTLFRAVGDGVYVLRRRQETPRTPGLNA